MRSVHYRTMSDQDILNLGDHTSGTPRNAGDEASVDHWVTIDHRHIPITLPHGQGKAKCPPHKKAFFQALGGIFKMMGQTAHTNPEFIAALSAYESSWLAKHARDLRNPFGLTTAGGNNLSFPSYEAAASYWLYHAGRDRKGFARTISGVATIGEFTSALHAAGYNAVDPGWSSKIAELYRTSIVPFVGPCGF